MLGPVLGDGEGKNEADLVSYRSSLLSKGENTWEYIKRESLTRTGRESREGSCGALGGSDGRESRSGEIWEGRPGTAQHGRGLLLSWNRVPGRQISLGKCSWNQVRVGLE